MGWRAGFVDKWFIKNPRVRKWITLLLEGGGDHEVRLFGRSFVVNSVREHGYLRSSRLKSAVFADESAVLLGLAGLMARVDTFVDVGANIGLFAGVMARFQPWFPGLKIVAFEADPDTHSRLKVNLSGERQLVHHSAIGLEAGVLRFVRGAVSHVTTRVDLANDYSIPADSFEVPAARLDDFEVPGRRLLIKIDVEGQEWEVLQSAKDWFDEERVVAVFLDGYESGELVWAFFRERGFELWDGRSLRPATSSTFALLALRSDWLATFHESD
jgi:FkbM family methyltransferase